MGPSFPSVSSCVCSVLMNERGELWLSCSVFLGLCACGLCGLSHSEEPWGDIFGHRLSWVQAHTESLTDAGKEERGMFSYWEETRPDYGGREKPREKADGSVWMRVCVEQRWEERKENFSDFNILRICRPNIWQVLNSHFSLMKKKTRAPFVMPSSHTRAMQICHGRFTCKLKQNNDNYSNCFPVFYYFFPLQLV